MQIFSVKYFLKNSYTTNKKKSKPVQFCVKHYFILLPIEEHRKNTRILGIGDPNLAATKMANTRKRSQASASNDFPKRNRTEQIKNTSKLDEASLSGVAQKKNCTKQTEITSKLFDAPGASNPTRITVRQAENEDHNSNTGIYDSLKGNSNEIIINLEKLKKIKAPPPITITNLNREQVHASLATLNIAKYRLKFAKIGIHVYVDTVLEYETIVRALKEDNKPFYTHDLPCNRFKKIVLRGLHKMKPEEVSEEIKSSGFTGVADVKIIYPKEQRYDNHVNYIIYIHPDANIKDLLNLRTLFKTIVKWDRYKSINRGPTQCYNCQRPGHGSRNCNMPSRCLWCGENHATNNCPTYTSAVNTSITQHGNSNPNGTQVTLPGKCCNCQGSHFANNKDCPMKKKYSDIRKNMANRNRAEAKKYISAPNDFLYGPSGKPVTEDLVYQEQIKSLHYADASRSCNYNQHTPGRNANGKELFSIEEIMTITREIFQRLKNCQTKEDQLTLMFEISAKYIYNNAGK